MKRSLFRVGAALATLALAGTLAACSNNSSSSSSEKPAGPASASANPAAPAPGEDAGFEEQPVEMEPQVGTPAAESSMHIEADIAAAADNKLGYGAGDFVPGLTVDYAIKDKSGNVVQEGTLMPMNASDGPHYGLNLPKLDAGTYDVSFMIKPPSVWLLHTDKTTGVEGRFWTEPLVAEFPDWQWDPTAVSW